MDIMKTAPEASTETEPLTPVCFQGARNFRERSDYEQKTEKERGRGVPLLVAPMT